MSVKTNDFVINIATVNGSGSQSANMVILRSLFKMGIPVGGKNVFPSNIAGLPTWFWIRANDQGFVSRREKADIVIAMNQQTIDSDVSTLKEGGLFIYNSNLKFSIEAHRKDVQYIGVPFKDLVDKATDSIKIKKLLINMIYVGVVAELLQISQESLLTALKDQFAGKEKVFDVNKLALDVGQNYARENLSSLKNIFIAEARDKNAGKILMDGNTASALGLLFGGCTFASWYPITPSSSLVENFERYAKKYRQTPEGKHNFAVIQAEDEVSAACMVLGAGWAGARAITATSGPGLSLMNEAIGYAYFTEIPAVIWDVQRVGPSTGMPTRTAQGDILLAHFASHGDTQHPVLIPGNIRECFEFGQTCFDLAERLQTVVFVLTDLDMGMNYWAEPEFAYPNKPYDRGKVLSAEELEKLTNYERYGDPDQDGIPYRALPGTKSDKAAYLTRGSGHNNRGQYTEKSDEYKDIVDRLKRKYQTAKNYVPSPIVESVGAKIGVIAYGSADGAMKEALHLLSSANIKADYLRLRALPFTEDVEKFIASHDKVYVLDLNRDGQMHKLLCLEYLALANKLFSVKHYDGTPITAEAIANPILTLEKGN